MSERHNKYVYNDNSTNFINIENVRIDTMEAVEDVATIQRFGSSEVEHLPMQTRRVQRVYIEVSLDLLDGESPAVNNPLELLYERIQKALNMGAYCPSCERLHTELKQKNKIISNTKFEITRGLNKIEL